MTLPKKLSLHLSMKSSVSAKGTQCCMLKEGLVVFHATPLLATSVGEKKRQETKSEGVDEDDDDFEFTRAKLLPSITCSSTYTVVSDRTSGGSGTLAIRSAPVSARGLESSSASS